MTWIVFNFGRKKQRRELEEITRIREQLEGIRKALEWPEERPEDRLEYQAAESPKLTIVSIDHVSKAKPESAEDEELPPGAKMP